jgi:hypothetical protein
VSESAVRAKRGWFKVWRVTGAVRNARTSRAAERRSPGGGRKDQKKEKGKEWFRGVTAGDGDG